MPYTARQVRKLLDPALIRPEDMPIEPMRLAESVVKRGVFALEDRAVREVAALYARLRQDLREDMYRLAENYGIRKLTADRMGQLWRRSYEQRVTQRVREMVVPVAGIALRGASLAWAGGYYGRAWMLAMGGARLDRLRRPGPDEVARMLAGRVGIKEDMYTDTMINVMREVAPDWLQLFENELDDLTLKIKRAIWQGLAEGEGIPEMVERVETVLGSYNKAGYSASFNRVQTIVRTVVNQASNNGAIDVYRDHPDVLVQYEWLTARDERVCFPAFTLVETASGDAPIQDVRPGMLVRTRKGFKRVKAVSRRLYAGDMVRVETKHGSTFATADHPFWTLEQGWLEGRYLQRGHFLQASNNERVEVLGVHNFRLRNTADSPTALSQIGVFAGVPYHKWASKPIYVYDIQVEDEPEFYANGVLVHNCPICRGLNGSRYELNDHTRPPAHHNCRCTIIPVIREYEPPTGPGWWKQMPTLEEWALGAGLAWWLNDWRRDKKRESDRWGDEVEDANFS